MFQHNSDVIEVLKTKNKDFYIVGDFNVNLIETKNNIYRKFNALLKRLKLTQCVTFPTRISTNESGTTTKSLIDLLITNADQNICKIESNLNDQIADHKDLIITVNLNFPKPKRSYTRTFRDKKKYNKEVFMSNLVNTGITFSANTDNLEIAVEFFTQCFVSTLDEMCPEKTKTYKYEFGIKCNIEIASAYKHKRKLLREISLDENDPDKIKQLRAVSKKLDKLIDAETKKRNQQRFNKYQGNPKLL